MTKKQGLIVEDFEAAKINGIAHTAITETTKSESYTLTSVEIKTSKDEKIFKRRKGKYFTFEMDNVYEITDDDFENIISAVAAVIRSLCKTDEQDLILAVGIGNRNVTADSLGPKVIDKIIVTRGLKDAMPELIKKESLANVCAVSANVFGVTGIESAELIEGISNIISPKVIILIDSLATNSSSRVCKTIQISNTPLTPGAGVGNARKKVSVKKEKTTIISIGMPTVLDISAVKGIDFTADLIATPMNIDLNTDSASKLIAFAINKAFHYNISSEDILKFLY